MPVRRFKIYQWVVAAVGSSNDDPCCAEIDSDSHSTFILKWRVLRAKLGQMELTTSGTAVDDWTDLPTTDSVRDSQSQLRTFVVPPIKAAALFAVFGCDVLPVASAVTVREIISQSLLRPGFIAEQPNSLFEGTGTR